MHISASGATHGSDHPLARSGERLLPLAAWGSLLAASALPLILWQELTGTEAPLWFLIAQVALLLVLILLVRRSPALHPLDGCLRWLLALAAGWHLLLGTVTGAEWWQGWQHSVPWVARGAVVQTLIFLPTLLMILAGLARTGRRDLRISLGDGGAIAAPDVVTLWRRPSWKWLGGFWTVGVSIGTLTAMYFAIQPDGSMLSRLLPVIPIVMLLAATNTVNEEFQFRNVPLAILPGLFGKGQALLMTGLFFGLEHYYGNPPAASGVLLATFLGYILGKSMLETQGSGWAWLIHWLQDLIIFSFLVMGWDR